MLLLVTRVCVDLVCCFFTRAFSFGKKRVLRDEAMGFMTPFFLQSR